MPAARSGQVDDDGNPLVETVREVADGACGSPGARSSTADESGALTSISSTFGGRASLWVGVVGRQ